jgi:CD2 antigen cytoplasmic tail-binding protein 2
MALGEKRLGEDLAGSSKKPRFDVRNPSTLAADAPEEDAILELDEIGGHKIKRRGVEVDGYDSDSSTENFESRADAKAKLNKEIDTSKPKSKDEEEDDMFADLEEPDGDDDEELRAEGKKKKNVRFLEDKEIEGQILSSTSGGHVSSDFSLHGKRSKRQEGENSESSEDDDAGDELRDFVPRSIDPELGAGHKKSHAPRLEAFNMKAEQEEGRFDENGNYVRKARDPYAHHDTWLEGVTKKQMKKAKEMHDKQEEERKQKELEQDAIITGDVLAALIPKLDRGETPTEALAALQKQRKPKPKPKWQRAKQRNGDAMEIEENDEQKKADEEKEAKIKEKIEAITDAVTALINKGYNDIWDTERELLTRMYKRETGDEWVDPKDDNIDEDAQWNFKWDGSTDVHGPYDTAMMKAWADTGYFTANGAEFQRVGEEDGWSRTADFM